MAAPAGVFSFAGAAVDNSTFAYGTHHSDRAFPVNIPDDALLAWTPADRDEARALILAVQARARGEGLTLPEPPPEPTTCCGRGCIGCVWEGYYSALAYWRDESVLRWAS